MTGQGGQSVLLCTALPSVGAESDLWLQQYERKVAEVVMYAYNPSIRRWRLKDSMFKVTLGYTESMRLA